MLRRTSSRLMVLQLPRLEETAGRYLQSGHLEATLIPKLSSRTIKFETDNAGTVSLEEWQALLSCVHLGIVRFVYDEVSRAQVPVVHFAAVGNT